MNPENAENMSRTWIARQQLQDFHNIRPTVVREELSYLNK